MDIHVGAVALWELGVTFAPAVIVSTDKSSLSIAGNVIKSCLDESVSEIIWQNYLQAFSYREKKDCYMNTGLPD